MWQNWVSGILGIVVIVIAFVGLTGSTLMWTLVVLGVFIAIFGFWSSEPVKK